MSQISDIKVSKCDLVCAGRRLRGFLWFGRLRLCWGGTRVLCGVDLDKFLLPWGSAPVGVYKQTQDLVCCEFEAGQLVILLQ